MTSLRRLSSAAVLSSGLLTVSFPAPAGSPCETEAAAPAHLIEQERLRVQRFEREYEYEPPVSAYVWGSWFSDFQSESAVDAYLDTLHDLSPDSTRLEPVGTSHEGRPIRALVFDMYSEEQDSVIVLGTQHAREWASPMVVSCIADALVRRGQDDAQLQYILERLEIAFVPMVNPDGYAYSRSTERMWRKNRNPSGGVDLNRNWGMGWDLTSASPTDETYPGSAAFSEPETAAVSDYVSRMTRLRLFLDYHSPAQDITYPYAYTSMPPDNITTILEWSTDMAAAISEVHGIEHGIRRTGLGGPAGGLSHDWAVATLGVVGMTPEIRPGESYSGFGMAPEDIIPTCEENFAGFVNVMMKVADLAPPSPEPPVEGTGGVLGAGGTAPLPEGATGGTTSDGGSPTPPPPATDPDDPESQDSTGKATAPEDSAGCSCRMAPGPRRRIGWFALILLLALPLRRRR